VPSKHSAMATGVVTRTFSAGYAAGYGFLSPDCGGMDRWFHQDDFVLPGVLPPTGAYVAYIKRKGPGV